MEITLQEFVNLFGDNIDYVEVTEYDAHRVISFIDHGGDNLGDIEIDF